MASSAAMAGGPKLAPGFLVATPSLQDPNFQRSVVLLVEHRDEGSLGFVVNRALDRSVGGILEELGLPREDPSRGELEQRVLFGGPVAPGSGWILFDPGVSHRDLEGSVEVGPRLGVSASRDLLEAIGRARGPHPFHLVLGHAGWGAGQLDEEIARGAWLPVELDEALVFETPVDLRWERAFRALGIDPARFVSPSTGAPS
jgi:putative transcriptional regulator